MMVAEQNTAATPESLPSLVRRGLMNLSALDRQLVVLHFGAGLTTDELGRTFEIPRRTVVYRVARAAERLCVGVPENNSGEALESGGIADAFCSGFRAPSGLYRKIEARLHSPAARQNAPVSRLRRAALHFKELLPALWRFLSSGERSALSHVE